MTKSSNVKVIKADGSVEWKTATGQNIRKSIPNSVRDKVVLRDKGVCRYCHRLPPKIHIDHVIPLSKGGSDDVSNLVVACEPCNLQKGDRIWKPRGVAKFGGRPFLTKEQKRERRMQQVEALREARMQRREAMYVDNRRQVLGEK